MSSLPRPAAASPKSNTTGELFRVLDSVLTAYFFFSLWQDYKQDVEALIDFIHANAVSGLDLDRNLHNISLVAEWFEIRVHSQATSPSLCNISSLGTGPPNTRLRRLRYIVKFVTS